MGVDDRQSNGLAGVPGSTQGVDSNEDGGGVVGCDEIVERECLFGSKASKEVCNIILLQQLFVGFDVRNIHCVKSANEADDDALLLTVALLKRRWQ